ncbi:MAG: hypothetical protein C0502_01835 [Opitutus sp.]|nr:hypothetical protein [Opitutus sp.]
MGAALFAGATITSAYDIIRSGQTIVKWPAGSVGIQVKVGTGRTLSDGTNFSTSFQAAAADWNAQMARLQLAGNIAAEGEGGERNGINETFFSPTIFGDEFGPSAIAVTTSYLSTVLQPDGTYRRTQSDIVFNSAKTWDSYRGVLRNATDFRRVALHELGHLLGLDHPDEAGQSVSAIMNSRVSSTDTLQQDDKDGIHFMYGRSGALARPVNNDFADATAVLLGPLNFASVNGSTTDANKEANEPNHAPNEPGGASIWWKWTAGANGTMRVSTAGSNFDTMLGAYTGAAVGSLTQLAANDDEITPEQDSSRTRPRTSAVSFTARAGATYHLAVDGWSAETGTVQMSFTFTPAPAAPTLTSHPLSQTVSPGGTATFNVGVGSSTNITYQWMRNGENIAGATAGSLTVSNAGLADAGLYTCKVTNSFTGGTATSNAAILGMTITGRSSGSVSEVGSDIRHPNGNSYDQYLLQGDVAALRCDAGQVTRVSFIDLSDDIVQVEFSGAGTLLVQLQGAGGPAAPAKYTQSVNYMKGHPRILLSGADATTNLTIFSVGRRTAFDPSGAFNFLAAVSATNDPARNGSPLFSGQSGTVYDGYADVASVAIASATGGFGGLRSSNGSYFATSGLTGVYAPGVAFTGPVFIGDIGARDAATPVILLGSAGDVRITGGDLLQSNDAAVQVSGLVRLQFTAGENSHGVAQAAQPNRARLEQNGTDVTNQLVGSSISGSSSVAASPPPTPTTPVNPPGPPGG